MIDDVLAPNVGRKLLLVDACRDAPRDPGRGSRGIQGRVIALPEDTAVLFSCRAGQESWDNDELQHGLFTYCVLEALRGEAGREQEVAWTDVVAHVNRRMASPKIRDRMPRPQDPMSAGGVPYTVLGLPSHEDDIPTPVENTLGMKQVLIPAGEFLMGTAAEDTDEIMLLDDFLQNVGELADEQPQHRVQITQPFYLGQHEVTQKEWGAVMGTNPRVYSASRLKELEGADTSEFPVDSVSWYDAVEFCNALSTRERIIPYYTNWPMSLVSAMAE